MDKKSEVPNHHSDHIVAAVDNALNHAREEFERKEKQARELLLNSVTQYKNLTELEDDITHVREGFTSSIYSLVELGIDKATISHTLGISEATLNRRLISPRKRRARKHGGRKVGVDMQKKQNEVKPMPE